MKDIFFKLIFNIQKIYLTFTNDSPFLPERMEIEKVEKLIANLHDKTEYVIHIKKLKQTLNLELVLKKVHRVVKFNQEASLKPYIAMIAELTKKSKK